MQMTEETIPRKLLHRKMEGKRPIGRPGTSATDNHPSWIAKETF